MAASKVNAGCAETQIVSEDLLLVSPFRMMITGPSSECFPFRVLTDRRHTLNFQTGSGKSTFILNLIKHRRQMFAEQFGRILYFRPHNDDNDHTRSYIEKLRNEFYDLEVMVGLPEEGMCGSKDHSLVSSCVCLVTSELQLSSFRSLSTTWLPKYLDPKRC